MVNTSGPPAKRWKCLFTAFLGGMVAMVGVGLAMNHTDQAAFCASCHTMAEAAWTHKTSIHAKLACNECHAPYALMQKLPFKAAAGLHDIKTNTLNQVADLIHANKNTKIVVQANCVRCHESTTQNVAMNVKGYCTDCHRAVPHNKKLPVSQRKAADV